MQLYLAAIFVFLFDQISKAIIISKFSLGESIKVLGNFLYFTYVQNTGIAFGFLAGQKFLILLNALIVIFIVVFFKEKFSENKKWNNLFLGLIVGGAVGNIVDRLRFSYVIDFIDLRFWPVFNVADSFICIGVALYAIAMFVEPENLSGENKKM